MGVAIALIAMFTIVESAEKLRSRSRSVSISRSTNSGKTRTITHNNGSQKLNIEYEGDIEFTDDDKSIKSISEAVTYTSEKHSLVIEEIIAEPNSDGTVEFEYENWS